MRPTNSGKGPLEPEEVSDELQESNSCVVDGDEDDMTGATLLRDDVAKARAEDIASQFCTVLTVKTSALTHPTRRSSDMRDVESSATSSGWRQCLFAFFLVWIPNCQSRRLQRDALRKTKQCARDISHDKSSDASTHGGIDGTLDADRSPADAQWAFIRTGTQPTSGCWQNHDENVMFVVLHLGG